MKKQLFTAIVVMGCLCGYAQTKGTNAVGFGIRSQTQKTSSSDLNSFPEFKVTSSLFSLNYGVFIQDNSKLSIELEYGKQKQEYDVYNNYSTKSYGGGLSYHKYYPVVKKLYVFAGGGLKYNYSETKYPEQLNQDTEANSYSIAADGGVAWFFSKRFAIESSLLTASANYGISKRSGVNTDNSTYKNTNTSFNLSSGGIFNNLGFKIYLLF